nr:MAG TPA: tail collar domain [Caudoviricetes sp.]DAU60355.1 MAG TPA: tail collar domain [Caudoviricetes sp.]DAY40340.1 MAG TPA: tail collar domain [Caudoviricetes sp.]
MQEYVATKQWRDGFGANETRITAADLTRIEDGISAATRGVTNLETKVAGQPAEIIKQVQEIAKSIRTELERALPVGTIAVYGAERDPEGWMRCDGRLLNRTNYAKLFAVLGTSYGSTNSNDFRLPDIRDRSVLSTGTSNRLGDRGGNSKITLSINQMPAHTHPIGESEDPGRRFQARTSNQDIGIGTNGYTYLTSTGQADGGRSPIATSVGGSQPIDIRDPYIALPYIIKVL